MACRFASAAAAGLLFQAACAGVPEPEVRLYERAFAAASDAGNRVYDVVSPIVADARPVSDATIGTIEPGGAEHAVGAVCPHDLGPQRFEACFEPRLHGAPVVQQEADAILARRDALSVVLRYNRVLAGLASGEGAAALRRDVELLTVSAGSLAALAGAPAAGALGQAIGRLAGPLVEVVDGFRTAGDLRSAVVEGAPAVDGLLMGLLEETPHLYALKREAALLRMEALELSLKTEVQFPAQNLVERHARPDDVARLEGPSRRIGAAFARADLPPVALLSLAGRPGPLPYDPAVEVELEMLAAKAEHLADAHRAEVDDLIAFHRALGAYVALLDATRGAFAALVQAADRGPGLSPAPGAIAERVAGITLQAREVRRLLRTIGAPPDRKQAMVPLGARAWRG